MLILLPLILYGLLHTGFMQAYLLKQVTAYLSKELQVEVSASGIDFSPFRSIILEEVSMNDRENRQLFVVDRLSIHLEKLSRRHKHLFVSEIGFDDASLNIHKNDSLLNYQFLIDYFSKTDTGETTETDSPWDLQIRSVRITNTILNYQDTNNGDNIPEHDPISFAMNNINLAMSDIMLKDNTIFFEIDFLRYKQKNGVDLNHLSGTFNINENNAVVNNFLLRTTNSEIKFDLEAMLTEPFVPGFSTDNLSFELRIAPSVIDLAEIAYYYKPFYGASEELNFSGNVLGSEKTINGRNISFSGGNGSSFFGDFQIADISDIQRSNFDVHIKELKSSITDIKNLRLPHSWQTDSLVVPANFHELGNISYTGKLEGCLNEFMLDGVFITEIGKIESKLGLQKNETNSLYQYTGSIQAEEFDLGKLFESNGSLGNGSLGKINLQTELNGHGYSLDNLNLSFDGKISSIDFLHHNYHNVELKGSITDRRFSGFVMVDDDDLFLDFKGVVDLSEYVPMFDFHASIKDANLTALNLFQRDSLTKSILTTDLAIKARARTLDDMEGVITINDLYYKEVNLTKDLIIHDTLIFATDSIFISNWLWPENQKHFRVRSDFVDADIHGKIKFDQIQNSFESFIHTYVPTLNNNSETLPKLVYDHQDIEFSIRIKEFDPLSKLFFPGTSISSGSWINGSYNSLKHDFELEAYTQKFEFAGRTIVDWYINCENVDDMFVANTSSKKLMLSDSLFLDQFDLQTIIATDSVCVEIHWNGSNDERKNSGHLVGSGKILSPQSFELFFLPSHIYVEGDLWQLNVDHKIFFDDRRIEIHQLMAYNNDQFIRADGVLSADVNDKMTLSFANFDVAFSEYLMNTKNFEFGGIMNGYVSFTTLYQQPSILTELFVKDFTFNHVHLGDLTVESLWDHENQAFKVDAAISYNDNDSIYQPLVVTGYLNPNNKNQNFDLDINLTNKKMSVWGRYMQGFAENFNGYATGSLRLDGAFSNPELTGNARVLNTGLHIPYLNTSYMFTHDVKIGKDYFEFDDVILNDTLGNTANLSGRLMHNVFKDFSIDFRLSPERMVVFNTTSAQRDYYYGTAFLTGLAHIHGPVTNITMDVSARTTRGTSVILPLDYTGDISESHFISFVTRDTDQPAPALLPAEIQGGMALNFDLEVTPDAEVQLLFDTRFGDIIRGRGTGNLKLEITPEGLFNIYGDYVIESGEYIFMLQNIINKRFRIEQGSTIRWTGDLNDADLELSAVYQVRTQLYDLVASEFTDPASAELYQRRLPIETVLILEDKLFNPAISFDIRVPGGDENTRELIDRVVTTEQEMNRQVFSLLVLNRFLPATFDQYNTALGYGVGSTSSELLSNQLSNWLSQISSDFDIGINYRPGDELSSQELELALSTQLFDDRVLIDGNFGVAGNETAAGHSTQGASQIIGDVNIEVKLTPEGKFRVKAFNRSNTFDILNTNAPYTQGIGVFYRREFDSFFDSIRKQRQAGELPEEAGIESRTDPAEASIKQDSEIIN